VGFDELIGNQRIKYILKNFLKNDIIPYSMIFHGPMAADMLGFATAFAKAINCLELKDDFCGHCSHCREAEKNNFLDLKIIFPDGLFFKKELVNFLVDDNVFKPFKGKRKINILVDVHKMNNQAANAFLKVLEEPAPLNVFILLTENLNALLPTIKSRCQIQKFSPLSREEIKSSLLEKGCDNEKAVLLSYLGQGSMESVLTMDYKKFMEKRQGVFTILSSLLTGKGSEEILLDLFNRSRSREKFLEYFSQLVNLLAIMIRDIMVLKIEGENRFVINVDYAEQLSALGRFISIPKILDLIRKMELLLRDIKRNLNIKVLIMEFMRSYTED